MKSRLLLVRAAQVLSLSILWVSVFLPLYVHAQSLSLPVVTGASYDGREITWNAVEGAIGYDIYISSRYTATVVGTTTYRPEVTGRYVIAAFDGNGNYSATFPADRDDSTSNFVSVDQLTSGVEPPENVTGIVYSQSAGEIFWDRLPSRDLGYQVFLNGVELGSTAGDSFFVDTLPAGAINQISVVARTSTEETSGPVALEFNTLSGPFPSAATLIETTLPVMSPGQSLELLPESPQNARLEIYGFDAAELFWDRPPLAANIVSTNIFRNGELIGSAEGNSFFDDTVILNFNGLRPNAILPVYELVAISSQGVSSLPAFIYPDALDPNENGESNTAIVSRLLSGITEVTTNSAHVQWFPILQGLANGGAEENFEEVSVEPIVEDGILLFVRTVYDCDFGTLILEQNSATISTTHMVFDECDNENGYFDGGFRLTGLDAGGYTASYEQLFIDLIDLPVDMDGEVTLTVDRATGGQILTYNDFTYGFVNDLLEDGAFDTGVTLNQQVADTVIGQPRHIFETNSTVSAPFTNGREVTVTTIDRFEEIVVSDDSGMPGYARGQLIVESSDGETLTLEADTGDVTSWRATLTQNGTSEEITGNWSATVMLPCISASPEDEAIFSCAFR